MASESKKSRTTLASDPRYRETQLRPNRTYFKPRLDDNVPIEIQELIWRWESFIGPLYEVYGPVKPETFPESLGHNAENYKDLGKIIQKATTLVSQADFCIGKKENVWQWKFWDLLYQQYDKDPSIEYIQEELWDIDTTTTTMTFRAEHLPSRPQPDIVLGIHVAAEEEYNDMTDAQRQECIHDYVLQTLETSADINLHPRPAKSVATMAYPFLIHEVKPQNGTTEFVENQLAKSLIFALELQQELCLSVRAEENIMLPVFGFASIGPSVMLYVAVQQEDGKIFIYPIGRTFNLFLLPHACAFVCLFHEVEKWARRSYIPFIKDLLTRLMDIQGSKG